MNKTLTTAALLTTLLPMTFESHARPNPGHTQKGIASYYHDSLHGLKTASGQTYNKHQMSAAHKTLPLGTQIRVTDIVSGNSIVVKVNDRGPFVKGRIIDLSREAADELGMIEKGITSVRLEVLSLPPRQGS